jgi:hypothetical protein
MEVCGKVDVKLQTVLTFMTSEDEWPAYTPDALLYLHPKPTPCPTKCEGTRTSDPVWTLGEIKNSPCQELKYDFLVNQPVASS